MKKSVLITGGSRGIGAACVKEFSKKGYNIIFLYRENQDAARRVCEETGAISIRCDISDENETIEAISQGKTLLGINGFDAVVCNAAISRTCMFADMTSDLWTSIMGTNLYGTTNVIKGVLPHMISEKSGSIIMLSSMWGETGASCEAAYSATKSAIIGLGKSLAKELGPSNIRVNIVSPGVIDTDMNEQYDNETMEQLAYETPLGRIGKPEEVAKVICFLASEDASFITGQIIGVNGGFLI